MTENAEKAYKFYGWEQATVPAITEKYPGIHTPQDLYDCYPSFLQIPKQHILRQNQITSATGQSDVLSVTILGIGGVL